MSSTHPIPNPLAPMNSPVGTAIVTQILGALAAAVRAGDHIDLVAVFERTAQTVLGAKHVRLRVASEATQARLVIPPRATTDAMRLSVPTCDPRARVTLDVQFDSRNPPGPQTTQALPGVVDLAALVLEARSRPPVRAPQVVTAQAALVGSSHAMRDLRERIERVASTDFIVLVQGESGTGKELVARQLHDRSRRWRGPFVAVNCAAIVDTLFEAELFGIEDRTATGVRGRRGKFEYADGGTLFLDEVGDLSLAAQAKLLRAIQEHSVERVGTTGTKRVDIRIVAATNRPLADMVARRLFREDLYYRLSGVEILVPPLRVRKGDIRELVAHFLTRHRPAGAPDLTEAALDALYMYEWPGNVRELERLIERMLALVDSDRIGLDDIPGHVRGEYATVLEPSLEAGHTMRAWGSRYARLVFERCGGNKRRTCELLDISYHTLKAYLHYTRTAPAALSSDLPAWVRSVSVSKR